MCKGVKYKNKYLKYKNKYLNLKQIGGKPGECGFGRTMQFNGTCWFNAVINALILSDNLVNFFKKDIVDTGLYDKYLSG